MNSVEVRRARMVTKKQRGSAAIFTVLVGPLENLKILKVVTKTIKI